MKRIFGTVFETFVEEAKLVRLRFEAQITIQDIGGVGRFSDVLPAAAHSA